MDVAVKFLLANAGGTTEFTKARKLPSALFDSDTIVQYLALCDKAQYGTATAELIIMELADGGDLDQVGTTVHLNSEESARCHACIDANVDWHACIAIAPL